MNICHLLFVLAQRMTAFHNLKHHDDVTNFGDPVYHFSINDLLKKTTKTDIHHC